MKTWITDIHGDYVNLAHAQRVEVQEVDDESADYGVIAIFDANRVDGHAILCIGFKSVCEEFRSALMSHFTAESIHG